MKFSKVFKSLENWENILKFKENLKHFEKILTKFGRYLKILLK